MIDINEFNKLEIRVGEILEAEEFPEADTAAYKLKIDFGNYGIKWSSAQITNNYSVKELYGRQVIAVMNLGSKKIGSFNSEVLVMGADDENGFVRLLDVNKRIKNGAKVN